MFLLFLARSLIVFVSKAAREAGMTEEVDFSGDRLYYVFSDLYHTNVIFTKEGEVCLIDHYNAGFYPRCFMEYIARSTYLVSKYLDQRLRVLPDRNLRTLQHAVSNFVPREEAGSEWSEDSASEETRSWTTFGKACG